MSALPYVLVLAAAVLAAAAWRADAQQSGALVPYQVSGDAIPEPLGGLQGDAVRGRALVLDRSIGNCLICHHAPEPAERFMGGIGPDLAGIGSRLTPAQIRLRVVDAQQVEDVVAYLASLRS
jgi:sulfur-oxidizing protein SoxX